MGRGAWCGLWIHDGLRSLCPQGNSWLRVSRGRQEPSVGPAGLITQNEHWLPISSKHCAIWYELLSRGKRPAKYLFVVHQRSSGSTFGATTTPTKDSSHARRFFFRD